MVLVQRAVQDAVWVQRVRMQNAVRCAVQRMRMQDAVHAMVHHNMVDARVGGAHHAP